MKIGVLNYRFDFYTVLRNILYKLPEVEYVPVRDRFSLQRSLALRFNRLAGRPLIPTFDLNNQFEDFDLNKVDLLHFSNGISYGSTPWLSHFETILPRVAHLLTRHHGTTRVTPALNGMTTRALEALAGKPCKQIIAWSENAAAIQRDLMSEFSSDYAEPILAKMRVLAPPQEVLGEPKPGREYSAENPMRFILTGGAFFRKGGREVLLAFEELIRQEGLPIHLVIVSSMDLEPYAARETEEDVTWAKKMIAENNDWIDYYHSLPNSDVLALLKQCDVGLLPSWADTYGLYVLEAQASGCPVITTDVRAFPEMNNIRVGWLINVPKNALGEALYTTPQEREQMRERIQAGLESIIRGIVENPESVSVKSALAIEKIRREHDPLAYADALREIYGLPVPETMNSLSPD